MGQQYKYYSSKPNSWTTVCGTSLQPRPQYQYEARTDDGSRENPRNASLQAAVGWPGVAAGNSRKLGRRGPHRKIKNRYAECNEHTTPQRMRRQSGNDHRGVAEIGHSAEGNITRCDEQVERHVQPEKRAQIGKVRGNIAQRKPRQQAGGKLDTGSRRLDVERRRIGKCAALASGRQHPVVATHRDAEAAMPQSFVGHHRRRVGKNAERDQRYRVIPRGFLLRHLFVQSGKKPWPAPIGFQVKPWRLRIS